MKPRKTGIRNGAIFDHVWHYRRRLGERKGERCRILWERADGLLRVEFSDGHQVLCSRFAIRRSDPSLRAPARQLELAL